MSSTDDSQRALLARFFEEHLANRAATPIQALHREGDDSHSYYVQRHEGRFPRERFELPFSDAEQIEASLNEQWAGGPYEGLGTALMKLAQHFRLVEEKADVSDFVYEMF